MLSPTLDSKAAAEWLGVSVGVLYRKIKEGVVPATKTGKAWRFYEVDLLAAFRSKYQVCPSSSTRAARSIGSISNRKQGSALDAVLAQEIGKRRKSSMTNSRQRLGNQQGL